MNYQAAAQWTARLTRLSRSNFYVSFLFLPKAKRNALYAVYSFCRLADDCVDEAPNPHKRQQGLERWTKNLQNAYQGRATHPVMIPLMRAIKDFDIPKEYFEQLLEGMKMDLTHQRYETFAQLREYCYRVASVVGLICIRIFGYQSKSIPQYAENLGLALQMTNIVRDVRKDASLGRIYLPLEDLRRFDVREEEILKGRWSERLGKLLAFQADRAESFYREAEAHWDPKDLRTLFPAQIMKSVYYRLLCKMRGAGFAVLDKRFSLPMITKLTIAFTMYLVSKMPWTQRS